MWTMRPCGAGEGDEGEGGRVWQASNGEGVCGTVEKSW